MNSIYRPRIMFRWVGMFLVFCWGLSVPAQVQADESMPELTGEAADLYKRGRREYRDENYDRAAETLREAYRRFNHPLLLYNIALAEWRAGSYERALRTARRADHAGISPDFRPKVSGLMRGLRVQTRAESVASEQGKPGSARASTESATESGGLSSTGWTGVALGSLGIGAFGGAVWMDRRVANLQGEFRRARRSSDPDRYRELQNRIVREQWVGRSLLGVGAALGAVGGYLIVRDLSSPSNSGRNRSPNASKNSAAARKPRVLPRPRPRGFGIQLLWF